MANRGTVVYTEPADVAIKDTILASSTAYLLSVLLTTMNERDSITAIASNPDNFDTPIVQLKGITDATKQNEMVATKNAIVVDAPVYASYINTIIKFTNEMVNTCGGQASSVSTITCTYPYSAVIVKVVAEPVIPDVQSVNPITGVGLVNASGSPIMVAGFKNPVPALDVNGNPTYYTVTHAQIFKEGPAIVPVDISSTVRLCGNVALTCPNRTKQYGWKAQASNVDNGYVWICSNILRQEVVTAVGGVTANAIPYVTAGDLIQASTFIAITTNLRLISLALDTYNSWWGVDGTCARTCQVACQRACMLACQSCYSGTCHNQNCGGFS